MATGKMSTGTNSAGCNSNQPLFIKISNGAKCPGCA